MSKPLIPPGEFDDRPEDKTRERPPERWAGSGSWLVVYSETGSFHVELPAQGTLSIGRSETADVRLPDPTASRAHAALHVGPGPDGGLLLEIEDLGSAHGVRIEGRGVIKSARTRLYPNEVFDVGSTMMLVRSRAGLARATVLAHDPDDPMGRLQADVARIAPSELSVLILGETGVGKEVMAETIHQRSSRARRELLRIHCAALSDNLLESELFGHAKGAFTGATDAKPGLLESASGGTVFLDEIGELPPSTQVKLLRVLEEKQLTRVGELRPRPIDVRFVAATNRDLEAEVEAGRFRRDLYYRLDGFTVLIPPLRERLGELPELARQFARDMWRRSGFTGEPVLGPEVLDALRAAPWPGNIRELKNVMERAVLLAGGGRILVEHVAPKRAKAAPSPKAEPDERQRIIDALERCVGNQTRAAELLGISRSTLIARLQAYDIPRPRAR